MSRVQPQEYTRRLNLFSKVNRVAVTFRNANPTLSAMTPIDLNDDEVLGFLKALYKEEVKYLLVGGFAMAFHGYVRATIDLDLWIKDEQKNLDRLKIVLQNHGVVGIDKVRELQLIAGFTQFSIGNSGFVVDPMKNLKSFASYDFGECYVRAQEGEYKHVKFKVINPADLFKEKLSTNHPKDHADIEYLKGMKLG